MPKRVALKTYIIRKERSCVIRLYSFHDFPLILLLLVALASSTNKFILLLLPLLLHILLRPLSVCLFSLLVNCVSFFGLLREVPG